MTPALEPDTLLAGRRGRRAQALRPLHKRRRSSRQEMPPQPRVKPAFEGRLAWCSVFEQPASDKAKVRLAWRVMRNRKASQSSGNEESRSLRAFVRVYPDRLGTERSTPVCSDVFLDKTAGSRTRVRMSLPRRRVWSIRGPLSAGRKDSPWFGAKRLPGQTIGPSGDSLPGSYLLHRKDPLASSLAGSIPATRPRKTYLRAQLRKADEIRWQHGFRQ